MRFVCLQLSLLTAGTYLKRSDGLDKIKNHQLNTPCHKHVHSRTVKPIAKLFYFNDGTALTSQSLNSSTVSIVFVNFCLFVSFFEHGIPLDDATFGANQYIIQSVCLYSVCMYNVCLSVACGSSGTSSLISVQFFV